MLQQGEDFLAGEDRRQALWAFGGGKEDGFDLFVKDLPVKKRTALRAWFGVEAETFLSWAR
jgi:hypothetical protein